jgi:hypothetical protein
MKPFCKQLYYVSVVFVALSLGLTSQASAQLFGFGSPKPTQSGPTDFDNVEPEFRAGDDKLTCDQIGREMQAMVNSPAFAAAMGNLTGASQGMHDQIEREKAINAAQVASDKALFAMESSPNVFVRMAAAEELKRRSAARDGQAQARMKPSQDKMQGALNDIEASGKPLMPRMAALDQLAQKKGCDRG